MSQCSIVTLSLGETTAKVYSVNVSRTIIPKKKLLLLSDAARKNHGIHLQFSVQ